MSAWIAVPGFQNTISLAFELISVAGLFGFS